MIPLTDVAWQRLTTTIGRLADQLDADGRADLAYLLDIIETLAEGHAGVEPGGGA